MAARPRGGAWSVERALAATLFAVIALRAATLTVMPLVDTDDSRYAEVGRQMVALGDWVTPHFSRETAFWGKPPLHFWATAAAISALGPTALAARLPSFAGGLAVLAVTYLCARRAFGRRTALLACLILATTAQFYLRWANCLTDMTLTACNSAALGALFAARSSAPGSREERRWLRLAFAGLGFGLLAKGPVVAVFCASALALASLATRDWSWLRRVPWWSGAATALGLALPWYAAAEERSPGFLRYFLVNENVLRFLSHDYGDLYGQGHSHPRGAIAVMLALGAIPWTPAVAACALGAARGRWAELFRERRDAVFLAAWALAPLLLFAASRNITITYVLPSLPPLAMLSAHALDQLLELGAARGEDGAQAPPAAVRLLEWSGYVSVLAFATRLWLDVEQRPLPLSKLGLVGLAFAGMVAALRVLGRSRRGVAVAVAIALLLPCADAAIRTALARELGAWASTEELTRFVRSDPLLRGCGLAAVGSVPFSAAYYMEGGVRRVGATSAELVEIAERPSCQLVLVKRKYLARLRPESLAGFHLLRQFGDYFLFRNGAPV
ncbi:MAG TPA: phospholipid carrier-dependent glycosyltransferase [Myxococcota bacterium]|nr:phospholipid carrier-dependent glycosyltransferase [Myxococcota bacterium]